MTSTKTAYDRLGVEMIEAFKTGGCEKRETIAELLCSASQIEAPQLRKKLYQALADVGVNLTKSPYREEQAMIVQKRKVAAGKIAAAIKKANLVAEEAKPLLDVQSALAASNLTTTEPGTQSGSDTHRALSIPGIPAPINATGLLPAVLVEAPKRPDPGPRIQR